MPAPAELIPAATVVIGRDVAGGVEVLMVERSSKVAFGGMWAFPGGRIEADDVLAAGPAADELAVARTAAVRETHEETALDLGAADLAWLSRWQPDVSTPRRFDTWFFLADATPLAGDVRVDGSEITGHRWTSPGDAMVRRDRGEIEMAPPTWMTLHRLADAPSLATAIAAIEDPPPFHASRVAKDAAGRRCVMWVGDAGYVERDADAPGARHRLVMDEEWRYEHTPH